MLALVVKELFFLSNCIPLNKIWTLAGLGLRAEKSAIMLKNESSKVLIRGPCLMFICNRSNTWLRLIE